MKNAEILLMGAERTGRRVELTVQLHEKYSDAFSLDKLRVRHGLVDCVSVNKQGEPYVTIKDDTKGFRRTKIQDVLAVRVL